MLVFESDLWLNRIVHLEVAIYPFSAKNRHFLVSMKQFSAKKSHDALRSEKLLRGSRNIFSTCVMCSGLCHAQ